MDNDGALSAAAAATPASLLAFECWPNATVPCFVCPILASIMAHRWRVTQCMCAPFQVLPSAFATFRPVTAMCMAGKVSVWLIETIAVS